MAEKRRSVDDLRAELAELYPRLERGDLRKRDYERALSAGTAELYREVLRERTGRIELLAEHHVEHAHMGVNQPVLREPQRLVESFFLTGRSLIRVRARLTHGQAPTGDERDATAIDEAPLDRIAAVRMRRDYRLGEAAAGVAICALAAIAWPLLTITGPIMFLLGALGVLHVVALPTRWAEVVLRDGVAVEPPLRIDAVGKKSARNLLRLLGRSI